LIVDEDDSALSRALVADLLGSEKVRAKLVDRATAEAEIESRAFGVAVIIPKGFGKPDGESVTLLHHPLSALESQWAEGIFTEVAMRRLATDYFGNLLPAVERPFEIERETPGAAPESFCSYSHSFAGMTLQYLLFWGMESGLLLLRERQRGVWRRLQAAPVPILSVLLGRALATSAIALLMVGATFGFGWMVFDVSIDGSGWGFLLLALAVSGLAAGTGLLVAALGGTESRARGVCILVILAVSMLGGLWLPAFLMPEWVRDVSLAFPSSWAMRGFDGVTWAGEGLAHVWPTVLMVAGFTAVCLGLAAVRFLAIESRRRRGRVI
jgi:ABC-2 type transport system permease protein